MYCEKTRLGVWRFGLALLVGLLIAVPAGFASPAAQQPPAEVQEDPGELKEQDEPESEAPPLDEGEEGEVSSDLMRDPLISALIKERRLVDKPRFSMLTGGKIQVQYYDADSDDDANEDDFILRRFRPFLMGHFATDWRWKLELELSSEITALEVDSGNLDIRDAYVRYQGFKRENARLTLGNQKVPFSRDFMNPSTSLLFPERGATGRTQVGVPDRTLGVHLRFPSASGVLVGWASAGAQSHKQDARGVRFESIIGASDEHNLGWVTALRLDVRPQGALRLGEDSYWVLSAAGYNWTNDDSQNPFTEQGTATDPEKADLDRAQGLELSGLLFVRGFSLEAQHNLIRAETVDETFTGGIYIDGTSDLETSNVQAAYRIPARWAQFAAGVTQLDSDGWSERWRERILGLNFDLHERYQARVQISHRWISARFGMPNEDYQESRIQVQYVW